MIIVTITHHVRPTQEDIARKRINAMTAQMSRQPGFIFRHIGSPGDDPLTIVTFTAWEAEDDLKAWESRKRTTPGNDAGASAYSKVERAIIRIDDETWADAFVEGRSP